MRIIEGIRPSPTRVGTRKVGSDLRVLRLGSGAEVTLFDGEGGEWRATIEVLDRDRVSVRVGGHSPPSASRRWI